MKIKILLFAIGIALPITSNAQKLRAGIFRTTEDYQSDSISIVADITKCKAIKIDDFFFRPYVWIKTSAGKQKIPKKDVFAVRMPDNKMYRIVNNENYLLLDTSNLSIYSKGKEISITKRRVHSTRYEHKKVNEYFFSTTIAESIQELNITNVRLALLKDKQFDNKLIAHFQTNKSLLTKRENGQFEINIFLNSIKN